MSNVLIAGAVALTLTLGAPVMAQTADSAAQAQIDDLKVQLRLLENQVDTMKAKADAKPAKVAVEVDNGSTTVGGQAFMDFGHISNQQNGVDVAPTGTGFDIKRFYLIVDHKFDNVWSANLTTDAQYISDKTTSVVTSVGPPPKTTTVTTSGGSGTVTEVFIKKLYLQATLSDAFVLHAGSYTSPWAPFVESLYGYRYIEKTQSDRLGYANTADWGLNASGKFGGGLVTYSASVVNGGGFKNPSRSKYVDYEGRIGVTPVKWLTFGAGFYSGHLGQINTSNQNFPNNTASRWDVAVGVNAAGSGSVASISTPRTTRAPTPPRACTAPRPSPAARAPPRSVTRPAVTRSLPPTSSTRCGRCSAATIRPSPARTGSPILRTPT